MGYTTLKNLSRMTSNKYRTSINDRVKVVFYGRVSTVHEAQMNALDNQLKWYDSILKDHPNWEKINIYVDRGVTGTQAKKRQGFMQMIEDAQKGMFDLVCTREVSRFARNTLDSLNYTRQLGRMGVEVFFYNDNIWSLESDGELRLTIMSAMSQEEARHISERVLAGQAISRKNGVLYGNGNILGYKLVRGEKAVDNTYEIVEEEAETVQIIYDSYLEGMGTKKIAVKLMELHRKTAYGLEKWDATAVLRILNNKTYAGYIGYNKSVTTDFLEHSRVQVRDKSKYEYVRGNFPAIIPEEKWNRVHSLMDKKTAISEDGTRGKRISANVWKRHLICECGNTFKRFKWHVSKNGEEMFGYQCCHQVNYKSKTFRRKHNLDTDGYCDSPSIAEWKLPFMLKNILERIWENPKKTVRILTKRIEKNYTKEYSSFQKDVNALKRELERLQTRLSALFDMRLDNQIDNDSFEKKKSELEERCGEIEKILSDNNENMDIQNDIDNIDHDVEVENTVRHVKRFLKQMCSLENIHDDLVDSIVNRIIVTEEGIYKFYLNTGDFMVDDDFQANSYVLYDDFAIDFDAAREYRRATGNFIRKSQWNDLYIEVYVRA